MPVYTVTFKARKVGSIGAFEDIIECARTESKTQAIENVFDSLHEQGFETLNCVSVLSENELDEKASRESAFANFAAFKSRGACDCRKGFERDNCSKCEGAGVRIDFVKLRSISTNKDAEGK